MFKSERHKLTHGPSKLDVVHEFAERETGQKASCSSCAQWEPPRDSGFRPNDVALQRGRCLYRNDIQFRWGVCLDWRF